MMKKAFLSICLCVFLAGFLTACNTTEGFGQDLKQGGQAISKSAKDSKNSQ
jgi:predicted small secreted protein